MLKDGVWNCLAHKPSRSHNNKNVYEILESGIYATVFYPRIPISDFVHDRFCGIICKDKRLVFMYFFLGLPALFILFYSSYRMYTSKLKHMNLTVQEKFVQEKLKEVENVNVDFTGQTIFEKLDEGVHYFVNPLRNAVEAELGDIRILNIKLEKLKAEKRKMQANFNGIMGRNKSKLAEIRKLRQEIDSY